MCNSEANVTRTKRSGRKFAFSRVIRCHQVCANFALRISWFIAQGPHLFSIWSWVCVYEIYMHVQGCTNKGKPPKLPMNSSSFPDEKLQWRTVWAWADPTNVPSECAGLPNAPLVLPQFPSIYDSCVSACLSFAWNLFRQAKSWLSFIVSLFAPPCNGCNIFDSNTTNRWFLGGSERQQHSHPLLISFVSFPAWYAFTLVYGRRFEAATTHNHLCSHWVTDDRKSLSPPYYGACIKRSKTPAINTAVHYFNLCWKILKGVFEISRFRWWSHKAAVPLQPRSEASTCKIYI